MRAESRVARFAWCRSTTVMNPIVPCANMEELYSKHKVFGVIGNVGTPTAEKTVPFALEKQMIYFGGFTGASLAQGSARPLRFQLPGELRGGDRRHLQVFRGHQENSPRGIAVFAQQDGYGDAGMGGVTKMLRKSAPIPTRS